MNEVQTIEALPPVKFSISKAAIAELRDRYKNPQVPATPSEYDELKTHIREVAKYRIAVNKERKEQTRLALDHQRNVNAQAQELTEAIEAIEAPMKAAKQVVDEAEERKVREAEEREQRRLQGIHTRLDSLKEASRVPFDADLEFMELTIEEIEAVDPETDGYDEFAKRAAELRSQALTALRSARQVALDRQAEDEKRRAEQAEIDRQKRELEQAQAKQREEQARTDAEQRDKEQAERAKEQEKLRKLEAEKREREEKERREREQARQLALAPDKEKLADLSKQLREAILYPECEDAKARSIVERTAREMIDAANFIDEGIVEL